MLFLDPDMGGGAGEQEANANDFQETFADEGGEQAGDGKPATQPTAKQSPTETPEQREERLAQTITRTLATAQQANQPAKQWTQAEIDKAFQVFQPSEDLVARIQAGGADAVKALCEMRDGLMKQSNALFQYQLTEQKRALQGEYAPALTYAQEARAAQERETFFETNTDLDGHQQAVETVFAAMKSEGVQYPTIQAAYDALAGRTRALLGIGTPGTNPPVGANSQQRNQQTQRPAAMSTGSQAGGGGGSKPAMNPFQEVFG